MTTPKVYYFGYRRNYGHGYESTNGYGLGHDLVKQLPFEHRIDGQCAPACSEGETEGRACLRVVEGWTVISFWDRSGDSRGKSNTALVAEGRFTFGEMVTLFKEHFPKIFARFPFEIVQDHGKTEMEFKGPRA